MIGYGILMIIFGVLLLIAGLYVYTGHNSELLLWKGYSKNRTKKELKVIGTATMLLSISPLISGIVAFFFEEDSFIPIIVLFTIIILVILICYLKFKK